jgi:hypothetical protein
MEHADQLQLFPVIKPLFGLYQSIEDAFLEFHRNNPHVYHNIRVIAFQALAAGRKKIGMKLIFERLRWEYYIATERSEAEFVLNNNYTSRYARLLMENEPELAGMFETRKLKA